ncbi:radical SAM protein [Vulcanisaeta souniana]|uniref:Radical SAM protein n=1 Tax=Vulcanisaeta souniana JCM 11219 TaxID=1293586 RepID=A0A830EI54_9CREN|nr:radical SAM protein [Vulcanisaeta souniana]BDR91535.1 radical SAM protein [Vulcanisaeta souniana JCM 11219]GGI73934.1 radical SAM protein [Vulcanisaeta souniana JCM 11219]
MANHVFGPVPSRRLGRSLGVNVVPLKYCNFNCIYCQLGRTRYVINDLRMFYPPEDIIKELGLAVRTREYDYLTFIGDGEPTLYAGLGKLIQWAKNNQVKPLAILTNGAKLIDERVRSWLSELDVVKVSTDAGREKTFRLINRPHRDITFDMFIEGIERFREVFSGQIWTEVMLVQGVNDNEDEMERIGNILRRYKPDRVYMMAPTRPPAESWVKPPASDVLINLARVLSRYVNSDRIFIIDYIERGEFHIDMDDPVNSLLGILKIQPMTIEQVMDVIKRNNLDMSILDEIRNFTKEVVFNGIKYLVYSSA